MAIAYLGYRVDSKQVATAEKRLDKMSGAAGVADRQSRTLASTARNLAVQLGGVVAVLSAVRGAINASQAYANMTNTLLGMGQSAEQAAMTLQQVADVSNRTRAPLEATAKLYQRVSIAGRDLGASSEDVLRFTENIGLALGAAGVGANEASGALLQLSQAMAGGVVRAEEFNSILEGAFPIAQAAANGIDAAGGSVGELRKLVIEGKVSSEEFFNSILSQTGQLEDAFSKTTPTISQAFGVLRSNLIMAVGEFDKTTGASAAFAGALLTMSENLDVFVDVAKGAAVVVGAFATRSMALAILSFKSYVISIGVAAGATTVFTNAVALANAALIRLGGPLGIVWGLIGAAGAAWIVFGDNTTKADEAMQEAKDASDALNAALGTFYQTAAPDAGQAAVDLATEYKKLANEAFNAAEAELAAAKATNDALMARQSSGLTQGRGEDANRAVNARLAEASAEYDRALAILEEARKRQKSTVTAVTGAVSDDMTETAAAAKDLAVNVDLAMTGLEGGGKAAAVEIEKIEPAIISATNAVSDMGDAVRDDLSRAWSDFVDRGFKDFDQFGRDVLRSFMRMVGQMILFGRNNPIQIGMGVAGGVGGAMSGLGNATGGLAGMANTALAGVGGLSGLGSAFMGGANFALTNGISGIGTALAGATGGLGGLAAAAGALAVPLVGVGLLIGAFTTKTKELDRGLRVAVSGLDATAETFRKIEKSRFFGLSKSRSTRFANDPDNPVLGAVASIQDGVLQAARVMGVGSKAFEDFAFDFKLSLKGLTEEQKLQKINTELSKMGDQFASIVPNFSNMNDLLEAANRAVAETAAMGSTRFESQVLAAARRRGEITMDRSGPGFAEGQSLIRLQKLEEIDTKVEENTRQNNRLTQKMVDLLERWEEVGIPRGPVLT